MGAVGKSIFLLTAVTFLLQISDSNAAFREFQDQKRDNFEMCVGGNGKEQLYRFCQRKVSANSRECYRREDMNGVCGCTVSQSSGGKNGLFNLAINCNGDSDSADICPQQKLGLYFQSDPITVEKTDCNCEKDATSSIQSAIICVLVVIIICLICKDRLLRYYRDYCQRRPAGTQRKAATHDGAQLFPAAETEPLEEVQIPKEEFL
ncbi:Hypothetical predicted protein [Cloeon dipterum]|uniref:Uncharacterized protein n=1 Tax=Cloeon dipterum TaxID=197152 RepID=A0A8S1EE15_9INSE|nr:Hypothetical predicted protein [Cloeon dipterum]